MNEKLEELKNGGLTKVCIFMVTTFGIHIESLVPKLEALTLGQQLSLYSKYKAKGYIK